MAELGSIGNELTVNGKQVYTSGVVIQEDSVVENQLKTTSVAIPFDDTVPLVTEGNEVMSLLFTPKSATSKLKINVNGYIGFGGNVNCSMALFRDGVCIGASTSTSSSGYIMSDTIQAIVDSSSTTETTFSVRLGGDIAGTANLNGTNGARKFGGVANSSIVVTEVSA